MSPYRFAFAAALVFLACGGKIDPNAGERTATRQVGTGTSSSGSSGTSSSSGTLPPSSSSSGSTGPCNGSGLIPFDVDFEDGTISDGFTINSPSAFSIEWDDPITGSASLRVKPNKASYMARQVKSVCAARLQFTVRASDDFLKTGSTLARIDAGSRRVTLSILAGGSLNLYEEVYSSNGSGGGGGGPYGTIFPNDPTTIFIDVDLPSSKLTFGVKSPKVPGETKVIDMIALPPDVAPAITSIELGTTPPGTAADPQGLYWLDDISID